MSSNIMNKRLEMGLKINLILKQEGVECTANIFPAHQLSGHVLILNRGESPS